ncbi:hypothetical protein [Bifidobacterium moukalabense]|uniref:hypothetical protein n=1 Tax=Bifidobacterium moukalabense TaxID=1333651 RepID=UPI0010F48D3B|nr:hypothetical protein [Bifidobacterium moukalabense]
MTADRNAEDFARIMQEALGQHRLLEQQLLADERPADPEAHEDDTAQEFTDMAAGLLARSRQHGGFFTDAAGRPILSHHDDERTPPTQEKWEEWEKAERARRERAQTKVNASRLSENIHQATGLEIL